MSFLRHSSLFCTFSLLISLFGIASGVHQCEKENSCKCNAGVSWSIDLSPLKVGNPPSFSVSSIAPETSSDSSNFTIYYDPCQSFWKKNETAGQCGTAEGVALCLQETSDSITKSNYTDLGIHDTSTFITTGSFPNENVAIAFTSKDGLIKTTLKLECDKNEKNGRLIVKSGNTQNKAFVLSFISLYSCANVVPSGGLSVGSVLLILVFSLVMLYLIGGMLYNHCIMGATGFEIIPHYEFWIDFPFLVKDGIIFIFKGCKTEPTYDRI